MGPMRDEMYHRSGSRLGAVCGNAHVLRALQAHESPAMPSFVAVCHAVRSREDMHDKFWRYLELFRDVVQKSDE